LALFELLKKFFLFFINNHMKKTDTLKALYLKELEENSTWRNDPKMVQYCINKASVVVKLPSG
jgi:hypothetical protein